MGSDTAAVSNVNIADEVRKKKKTKKRKRDQERETETRAKLSGGLGAGAGGEVEAEVTVHRVQGAPHVSDNISGAFFCSIFFAFLIILYLVQNSWRIL